MLWHECGWSDLADINKQTPVVVPLGSCEQHGRHLPLFVDTFQVTRIAEEAERKLGDEVLLLPTLWLGCSEHHRDFPGTVSVKPSLYAEMIRSIARSILGAGFSRIIFLNGHGGNRVPTSQALTEWVAECDEAEAAHLVLATWWELNPASTAPETLAMTSPRLMHACEYETSLMLAIRPDLVKLADAIDTKSAMKNDWVDTHNDDHSRVSIFKRVHRISASGSIGTPSAATEAKGQRILEAVTDDLVHLIRDVRHWDELKVKTDKKEIH